MSQLRTVSIGMVSALVLLLGNGLAIADEVANAPKVEAGKKVETSRKEEGDYVVEKRSDGSTVKYKKKTSYDFEGSSIEGLYNKPSGSYISNIKDVKGKSIIRIRENFDAEVIDSSRLLK